MTSRMSSITSTALIISSRSRHYVVKLMFLGAALGLIVAAAGLALYIGAARWSAATSRLTERLSEPRAANALKRVRFQELEGLPAPVVRYFRLVLKDGQPLVRSAKLIQAGEFRRGEADAAWQPFESKQSFSAGTPGFVWDAAIRVAPLLDVRVRDGYVDGQGSMQAKLMGLVTVVDERGKPELNSGALQRYLAEAVWFPTALLAGRGVTWSAIDDQTALATLTDSGTKVSLQFQFDAAGEITGVFTPGRYREVNGRYQLTPWAGFFGRYEERMGMRIPVEAYVEWQHAGEKLPYWRGRIVEVEYEFEE